MQGAGGFMNMSRWILACLYEKTNANLNDPQPRKGVLFLSSVLQNNLDFKNFTVAHFWFTRTPPNLRHITKVQAPRCGVFCRLLLPKQSAVIGDLRMQGWESESESVLVGPSEVCLG